MRSKYTAEIKDLGSHLDRLDNALVIVEGHSFHDDVIQTVKELLRRDRYGIYVSLNKPHFTIEEMLRRKKIDVNRIYFVDCITAAAHYALDKGHSRVLYAAHPSDVGLDGTIPHSILHFIDGIPGEKFIIVDALRTLFLYNETPVVIRFVRSLLKLKKTHAVKVIFMARSEHDEEVIHRTQRLFDDVVYLK